MVTFLEPTGTPTELAALGYTDSTWDRPPYLSRGQLTAGERMRTAELASSGEPVWVEDGPGLDVAALDFVDPLTGGAMSGSQFLDRRLYSDALLILHRGRLVYETYRNGMVASDRHINHSTTKTLTSMLVGIAVGDGVIDVLTPMPELIPELASIPAWNGIALQDVLDMAAGIDTDEHYENPDSMFWRYMDVIGYYGIPSGPQTGTLGFVEAELTRAVAAPGSRFNYASYLTNLIPIAVENAYGESALDLLETRIYSHLGAERSALLNIDTQNRPIAEGQLNLTLRDFARWAAPFNRDGLALTGQRVLPSEWIEQTLTRSDKRRRAFVNSESAGMFGFADSPGFPDAQYHNQAWILDPERQIMAMIGIHGQFCYIDRTSDLMIVGFGSFPDQLHPVLSASMTQLWAAVTETLA